MAASPAGCAARRWLPKESLFGRSGMAEPANEGVADAADEAGEDRGQEWQIVSEGAQERAGMGQADRWDEQ